ncbi:MAG TPA: hypothetical protein VFY16_11500 [Gemmatimonadaceae bacterium]|nr:hypothetical protein [Gemmatimonadaceae bacterium]
MRARLFASLSLLPLLGACATATVASVGPACGAEDDRSAAVSAALQAHWGPTSGPVVVSSDGRECEAAVRAMRRAQGGPPAGVYVFRLSGGRFGVLEAAPRAEARQYLRDAREARVFVFDDDWRLLELARVGA